jgi:hypothetical protein
MDILSFALYHENTKVVVDDAAKLVSPDLGQKRRREEHDVTDSSKENDAQRRRRPGDVDGAPSSSPSKAGDVFTNLKASVYGEITRSLEDSIAIEDLCANVEDRAMVARAVRSLEDDGKVMRSDGEVYLID